MRPSDANLTDIYIIYLSRRLEVIGSRDGPSDSVEHGEADCFHVSVLQSLGAAFSSPYLPPLVLR